MPITRTITVSIPGPIIINITGDEISAQPNPPGTLSWDSTGHTWDSTAITWDATQE